MRAEFRFTRVLTAHPSACHALFINKSRLSAPIAILQLSIFMQTAVFIVLDKLCKIKISSISIVKAADLMLERQLLQEDIESC